MNEFDIYASTDIFHCLPKDAVLHQLVHVFFERGLGLFADVRVHTDVRCHRRALVEAHGAMDFIQAQTEL